MFLDRIMKVKQEEIAELKSKYTPRDWEVAAQVSRGRSLSEQMAKPQQLSLIAEVKPASPSKGVIRKEVDPVKVARLYEQGGAHAISVLTDRHFFSGHIDYLMQVKQHVKLPVLRKDFIIDPVQVLESKRIGADAILLIAALLNENKASELVSLAHDLGLEVLFEIHGEEEIDMALKCRADVIGINNRNLKTFVTDLTVTERLRPLLPKEAIVIGESGIHSREDAERMAKAGVQGILVGEYLMRQENPRQAVQQLIGEDKWAHCK